MLGPGPGRTGVTISMPSACNEEPANGLPTRSAGRSAWIGELVSSLHSFPYVQTFKQTGCTFDRLFARQF